MILRGIKLMLIFVGVENDVQYIIYLEESMSDIN
jgi:hypothetical protein